jgi:anti-sigma factor RsiW
MNCDAIRPLFSAYADGVLDAEQAAAVEAALARCPDCQAELDRMQAALALLDQAAAIELPPAFEAGFRDRLAQTHRHRKRRAAWVAAGVALAAGLLIFALWPTPQPAAPPDAMIAQLELLQDYEVIDQLDSLLAAESLDDVAVIATLDALEEEAP